MAEKEEKQKRLLIKEYDLVCDLTDCEYCEEKDWCSEKDGITRQQAINRMAKAIWEIGYNEVLNISFDKLKAESHKSKSKIFSNFYKLTMERAQAALNSLLED